LFLSSKKESMSDPTAFPEFCAKVRNSDPSILPQPDQPFIIRPLSEQESIELSSALLENTNVTYLRLQTQRYSKHAAEAMAEYVSTSKRLRRICWIEQDTGRDSQLQQYEEMLCYFLPAFQLSTSLKELTIHCPRRGGPSNLAFENMLTHTQSLQSLTLHFSTDLLEDIYLAAARSGLKNNTTLRELTINNVRGPNFSISPIFTSLRDHPLLRRLCLRGNAMDLDGLETVLLSETSKVTELDICMRIGGPPIVGLTRVLRALTRRPTLTKLGLQYWVPLGRKKARLLGMVLHNTLSLHTLALIYNNLGSVELAELAPALYRNTSITELSMSCNGLNDMESAELLRGILRSNKTVTTLNLSGNFFGQTTGAVACIADGLGSNSTLMKIDLSSCALRDGGVSILAQALGSRNTTLQKLTLKDNSITSTGVGALVETMGRNSNHITDLELGGNPIGKEGANLLARALENNALPNLTRLSLAYCGRDGFDNGFTALISALEQNTSLLQLDLCSEYCLSERALLALPKGLPEIKALQRLDISWCAGLASAMPSLLEGLRKNTSLFCLHVTVPPTPENTARCAGGWMQAMERLGYRNRFLPLIRAPKERQLPRGVWSHALARVATLPDVIFKVLRSKPSLVPSEGTEGKEAAQNTSVLTKN
jgi:Ran GTPase-activating protein (RanGAP) involved in mRNA processing and transport